MAGAAQQEILRDSMTGGGVPGAEQQGEQSRGSTGTAEQGKAQLRESCLA